MQIISAPVRRRWTGDGDAISSHSISPRVLALVVANGRDMALPLPIGFPPRVAALKEGGRLAAHRAESGRS
jgi:hypothetical protein